MYIIKEQKSRIRMTYILCILYLILLAPSDIYRYDDISEPQDIDINIFRYLIHCSQVGNKFECQRCGMEFNMVGPGRGGVCTFLCFELRRSGHLASYQEPFDHDIETFTSNRSRTFLGVWSRRAGYGGEWKAYWPAFSAIPSMLTRYVLLC